MGKVCRVPCSRPGCLQIMLGSALVCSCCFRRPFANFKPFVFEEGLARKLCFHIFNSHLLREASHSNFFHIFYFHVFREVSHEKLRFDNFNFQFWRVALHDSFFYIFKLQFLDLARKLRLHNFDFQLHIHVAILVDPQNQDMASAGSDYPVTRPRWIFQWAKSQPTKVQQTRGTQPPPLSRSGHTHFYSLGLQ